MPDIVAMDSSAILTVLQGEVGAHKVGSLLGGALLSTVNLTETHAKTILNGVPAGRAWSLISALRCEVCPFTAEQARIAAELVSVTKPFGLSLGDRACLALAIERKATVYTTDRIWKSLNLGIEIEVIR